MVIMDVVMENLTSPAALNPYAGTNEPVHINGLTIVIAVIISIHNAALVLSIPAITVTGLNMAYTKRHDMVIPTSAIMHNLII